MDESFDAKLIKRLRNYSEEPRPEIWQNISARAEAIRPRARFRRLGSTWVILLGVITVGGLYYLESTKYLERAKSDINAATGSSESVSSSSEKNENGIVSLGTAISKDIETNRNDATSGQSVTSYTTKNRDNVIETGSKGWLKNGPGIADNESFPETNSKGIENGLDSGFVEDPTAQANASANSDNSSIEKGVDTTPIEKASKGDEGNTVIREREKKRNRFSIYFTIMPTFGYQRINSNSSDDIIIESVKRISTFSTDRLGVRAELGVEDPLTQRIKVFGGLVYYQRKQTINYTQKQVEYTEVSEGPDGQVIVVPQFTYVEKTFEYELKNLGVQVGLSYELSRNKLLQTLGTGFEVHVALNKLESSQAPEFTNNPSAYVFYNLYYRLQYPAEGRLKAVFQPTLNYSFYINQNLNAPFYVKPYGLGLNLGFTYNF